MTERKTISPTESFREEEEEGLSPSLSLSLSLQVAPSLQVGLIFLFINVSFRLK